MMKRLIFRTMTIIIVLFNMGCKVWEYTMNIGGNDYTYQHDKVLAYDGQNKLFLLSGYGYSDAVSGTTPYILETIDITSGARNTVVGTQTSGTADGIGTSASFNTGRDLVYKSGSPGIIYVADGCVIRTINTSTWQMTTIAGSNSSCTDTDGTGTGTARFTQVNAVEIFGGDLYIATSGYKIRKMNLTSLAVTTVAGNGSGYNDATGTSALFAGITSLKIIGSNLYILDSANQKIRVLNTSNNAVTTLAGSTAGYQDGIGTSAKFSLSSSYPYSRFTSDGTKYLFLNDTANCAARKIDVTNGTVSTILQGSPQKCVDKDGLIGASDTMAFYPNGITFTPYGLYIANAWGIRVIK